MLGSDYAVLLYCLALWRLFGWLENRERRAWRRMEEVADDAGKEGS